MKVLWTICKKVSSVVTPWRVAQRYRQIVDAVRRIRPRTILEVGTWNGERAMEMAAVALEDGQPVRYYGFDLFELMTAEISRIEFNVKTVPSEPEVTRRLEAFQARNPGFSFKLYKGFTKVTLPVFLEEVGTRTIDLIWIDGGHSVDTIQSDWDACSQAVRSNGVILLDDFYTGMPDGTLEKIGCNKLVERLKRNPAWRVEVLPAKDRVRGGGYVQVVRVQPSTA